MLQPDGSDLPVKAIQAANLGRHPRKEESMAVQRIPGFRLGVYVFKDAEIVDFAAPYGVFSVARRFDAELDAFLIADAMRPVQTQGRLHRPPELLVCGSAGDGRIPDPRWIWDAAGDSE